MSSDYDMFQLSDDELDEDFEVDEVSGMDEDSLVDEEGVASSSDDQACEQPNDGPSITISSYVYTPLPPEDEMEDETELMPGHGPVHGMEDETTNDGQDEADDSNDELDDSGDSECELDDDSDVTSTQGPRRLFTRLLTVHPGKHCDRIEVDLEVVVLGDERQKHPTYDVLSYVWGSKAKPCFVYVSKEKRILRITRNLDEAIRHLRYLDCPRYIWIDALCIDQGNPEERSRQVAYMGRIYWTAPSVVVWLGPRADNSDGALETLQDIGNQAQFNLIRAQMTGTTDLNHVYRGTPTRDLPIAGELFIAIAALLQRPWFERMWIRQEVFKANDKKSRVVCGKKIVEWGAFRRGLYSCFFHRPPTGFRGRLRQANMVWNIRIPPLKVVLQARPYSLTYLRHETVGAKCTDARDRIYALLGMLHDSHKSLGIVPDYSKTAQELYLHVALRYLETFKSLQLLQSCAQKLRLHRTDWIPTWVPDWSSPLEIPYPLVLPRVFCPFYAYADYLGDGILRAAGVSLGTIQSFIDLDVLTLEHLAASIRQLLPRDARYKDYPGGGKLLDAFRITLCAEFFCDRTEPPNFEVPESDIRSLSSKASEEAMARIMTATGIYNYPALNFLSLVRGWHDIGRFFITKEGYLGWGPRTAEIGDQIISFLGCQTPILLSRPPRGMYFRVIDACYLHGFMFGEAFLGPLPDGLHPVQHTDKSQPPRFHNSETGDAVIEDPRLSTLPNDLSYFRSQREAGYIVSLDIAPETWRSRGVEVVDFYLV